MTTQLSSWCHPPERLELKSDEVYVWSVRLAQPSSTLKSFLSLLSSDEERRAEGFYFQKDRNRFIAAHGALRIILSRYLSVPPRHMWPPWLSKGVIGGSTAGNGQTLRGEPVIAAFWILGSMG